MHLPRAGRGEVELTPRQARCPATTCGQRHAAAWRYSGAVTSTCRLNTATVLPVQGWLSLRPCVRSPCEHRSMK
jgi:hypothetical protein